MGHKPTDKAACYPTKEKSRELLKGNRKFILKNPEFCLTLGLIYWASYLLLTFGHADVSSAVLADTLTRTERVLGWAGQIVINVITAPMFVLVASVFGFSLYKYADEKKHPRKSCAWPFRMPLSIWVS